MCYYTFEKLKTLAQVTFEPVRKEKDVLQAGTVDCSGNILK